MIVRASWSSAAAGILLVILSGPPRAAGDPSGEREPPASAAGSAAPPSGRAALVHTLQDVARRYGKDAVMLEGQLLSLAIHGGSVRAAGISVPGVEPRGTRRFLRFEIETGIVYNDREVSPAARPQRLWRDIVATTLRTFRRLTLPADGIAFIFNYTHRAYGDEPDVAAALNAAPGDAETAAFYVPLADAAAFSAQQITSQQLLDRSVVLVNGAPTRVVLAPAP